VIRTLLLVALALVALGSPGGAQGPTTVASRLGYPQMVVYNAKIVTMDDGSFESKVGTIHQAMAIRDGRILATGANAEMRALAGPQTRTLDLKGRTVLPGLILTHEHPTDWVFQHPQAITHVLPNDDLLVHRWMPPLSAQEQFDAFTAALKQAVTAAKPGQWILISFNRYAADGRDLPGVQEMFRTRVTKTLLDQIAPNNPVKIKSGFNNSVINQKAIDAMRVVHPTLSVMTDSPENSTPPFDVWLKTGAAFNRPIEPDVIFKEHLPVLANILKAEMDWWSAWGVTTIGSSPYAYGNLKALDYLDKRSELPVRYGWAYTGPDWGEETLRYFGSMLGHGTDHLWLIGAWARAGSTCMTIPRAARGGEEGARDLGAPCVLAPGTVHRERTETLVRSGLRLATIYVNGDKDIDYLMDAIEKGSKDAGMTLDEIRAKRHSFDGRGPRPDQIARMKRLGMSGTLFNGNLEGAAIMAEGYGSQYADWVIPRMSFTRAGVMSTNGVDAPKPRVLFREMLHGMTRVDPDDKKVYGPNERSDRIIQLKAVTRWGAYAMLREDVLGSLEPGKLADFIVLDRDFLTIPEQAFPDLRVLFTVVGGKPVYIAPAFGSETGMAPIGPSTWTEKVPAGW
jgi:predicted amidohydrolase YtcJ